MVTRSSPSIGGTVTGGQQELLSSWWTAGPVNKPVSKQEGWEWWRKTLIASPVTCLCVCACACARVPTDCLFHHLHVCACLHNHMHRLLLQIIPHTQIKDTSSIYQLLIERAYHCSLLLSESVTFQSTWHHIPELLQKGKSLIWVT